MNGKSEMLHYIRGLFFVEKLKKNLSWEKYSEKSVCEFFYDCEEKLLNRTNFSSFDLNNFNILCAVTLLGLNKESIEKNENLKNYKYDIKYICNTASECVELLKKQILKSKNPLMCMFWGMDIREKEAFVFDNNRVISTPYDEWLSVINYTEHKNLKANFLFFVRNAFMHSEYNIELLDDGKNFLFINVKNSNYTNFEGKILACNFAEFIKFFYSNDAYFGLVDKYFIGQSDNDDFKIKNKEELEKISEIELLQIKYTNCRTDGKKIFENINYGKRGVTHISKYNVAEEIVSIDQEKEEQIKLLIEKYYGNDFYSFEGKKQADIIFMMKKYLISPSSYISEWIMHFYLNVVHVMRRDGYVDNIFAGTFALDSVFVILKSYLIVYRLQNKSFKEVDYNLINNFSYHYSETADYDMYQHFKTNLKNKGIICTEEEEKNRYICEIFRDVFAHGNLDVKIEKDTTGVIVQKLILQDIYKGKVRELIVSIEDLNVFLDSEAFSRKNAQ